MGKFLGEYQEALQKAKQEGRQIRVGAVVVDSEGRYLILGRFMGRARGSDGALVDIMTHELPSGRVYEHGSLETATLKNVHRETGLDLPVEAILGYLDHFPYEFKHAPMRGKGEKTQFNFLVDAGKDPQVKTGVNLKSGQKRGFSWLNPIDFSSNGYHLSPETKGILTLPKIEQILALRKK